MPGRALQRPADRSKSLLPTPGRSAFPRDRTARSCPLEAAMVAAFFFVIVAYIGFADAGSRLMDPAPRPERALAAPEAPAPTSTASRDVMVVESSAGVDRPAGR